MDVSLTYYSTFMAFVNSVKFSSSLEVFTGPTGRKLGLGWG